MDELIDKLKDIIPGIKFDKSESFCWSPASRTITYTDSPSSDKESAWSLLHEAGHALLSHQDYDSDIQLVLLEVAAWEKAKSIGSSVGITIEEDHIQDCLDTYRDWLHQRSTCPRCGVVSLQVNAEQYTCHNCTCVWVVSSARFCRPYRRMATIQTKKSLSEPKTLSATFS